MEEKSHLQHFCIYVYDITSSETKLASSMNVIFNAMFNATFNAMFSLEHLRVSSVCRSFSLDHCSLSCKF